jgi:hypothetical protein
MESDKNRVLEVVDEIVKLLEDGEGESEGFLLGGTDRGTERVVTPVEDVGASCPKRHPKTLEREKKRIRGSSSNASIIDNRSANSVQLLSVVEKVQEEERLGRLIIKFWRNLDVSQRNVAQHALSDKEGRDDMRRHLLRAISRGDKQLLINEDITSISPFQDLRLEAKMKYVAKALSCYETNLLVLGSGATWGDACDEASNTYKQEFELLGDEFCPFTGRTVQRWFCEYVVGGKIFKLASNGKASPPSLFKIAPEFMLEASVWGRKHITTLNSLSFCTYLQYLK